MAAIKARGAIPVCTFSVGTWERWRPDAGALTPEALGRPLAGWAGERWLDIRSPAVRALIRARLELCRTKGFAAALFDNADGWSKSNGLGLTALDQLDYNAWLAAAAHELGLGAGLKNDAAQLVDLADDFDFFVAE